MKTNFIICPSLSDVTNFYPLPQPAFNTKFLKNINNFEIVKKGRVKINIFILNRLNLFVIQILLQ